MEQTAKLLVIWAAMTLIRRHCYIQKQIRGGIDYCKFALSSAYDKRGNVIISVIIFHSLHILIPNMLSFDARGITIENCQTFIFGISIKF